MFAGLQRNLLGLDGGDHARLRALVHRAFTTKSVDALRDDARVLAEAALDRAAARGEFDLVADFGVPVPLAIIGRMLGVPDEDHPRFGRWWRAFVAVGASANPIFLFPSMLRLVWYLRRLIAGYRRKPAENLISRLVEAREWNERLDDDEVLAMVLLLLSAGHETTVNLVSSGVLALLSTGDGYASLSRDPTLVATAVEELLRFTSPAETATERYASRDVEIAGTRIPKGEMVLAVLASANRDASKFDEPDRLDIARTPNRHLAFGLGLHHCLGAPLARVEAGVLLTTLVTRAPGLRIRGSTSALRWRAGMILRGLVALPVTL